METDPQGISHEAEANLSKEQIDLERERYKLEKRIQQAQEGLEIVEDLKQHLETKMEKFVRRREEIDDILNPGQNPPA